jgi:hypothetical protein
MSFLVPLGHIPHFLTAAIVLWNIVYIERAVESLRRKGERFDENLLQYTSPLPWGHITLTGDYLWETTRLPEKGKYRPLIVPKEYDFIA